MKKGLTPEEYRAYQRASYAKHAEKRRAARKKRYWDNPEKARADALAYQHKVRGKPKKIVRVKAAKRIASRAPVLKVKMQPLPTEIRDAYKASSKNSIIQKKYPTMKALEAAFNRGELSIKPTSRSEEAPASPGGRMPGDGTDQLLMQSEVSAATA
jgi:hypothetical protein